ncbi:MAG: hypothetical protein O2909_10205, partial [Chloroflexi bacterium]|nr:hypothetical protein [Chloroflexota bacterium]
LGCPNIANTFGPFHLINSEHLLQNSFNDEIRCRLPTVWERIEERGITLILTFPHQGIRDLLTLILSLSKDESQGLNVSEL